MATISSHTLNGVDGTHAGGIQVTLKNISTGDTLIETTMDDAGRLSEHVDISEFESDHQYELTFMTADYWGSKGMANGSLADEIVLRFRMPDAEARYHRPLILSPNSYSCWISVAEKK